MRPMTLAFCILVLAGCAQPVSPPPARAADVPPAAFVALNAVIDRHGGQGEPSLGIAPDGTLYADGLGRGSTATDPGGVYKSTDGGKVWTYLASPTAPAPNFDPDLAVDRDGTVWFDALDLACSSTATSRDAGNSWTTNFLGCVPPAGDRQYIVPTSNGTAFIYSHHAPENYQAISKTTDYGATWLPVGFGEGPLGAAQGESGWGGGGYWNAAKGSVHLTWTWFDSAADAQSNTRATAAHAADAHTRDAGATWDMTQAPNAGGAELGLGLVTGAADRAGNVYLTWAEEKGDHVSVYLSTSKDDGNTWSPPILVDGDAGSKVFPIVAALDAGHVAIAYYHTSAPGDPSKVPADATWNVTLAWTSDALAQSPSFQHADLSTHILHKGPICPDGAICQTDRSLLDYFALKAMPDGRVASVWTSTEDVKGNVVNVFGVTANPILKA